MAVAGSLVFQGISAGGSGSDSNNSHACGLTTGGAAYCWGYNNSGQVGDGTETNRSTPVAVLSP